MKVGKGRQGQISGTDTEAQRYLSPGIKNQCIFLSSALAGLTSVRSGPPLQTGFARPACTSHSIQVLFMVSPMFSTLQ